MSMTFELELFDAKIICFSRRIAAMTSMRLELERGR
jgi:hypothetical protein